MARELNKLTVRGIVSITKPGRHGDGGGLYLVVDKSGSKRWVFLFRQDGRLREMGLGGLQTVSLAKSRALAQEARTAIADGRDPINDRKTHKAMPTFGEIADDVIDSLKVQWRNEKHIAQWEMTLRDYAKPLRPRPVDAITTADVLVVLKPLWLTKPETASRLRGRIERVLDAAKALGFRTGENPAVWRGHLKALLPARQKLTRGHHAALPFRDTPNIISQLRENGSVSAMALEFAILTASRSGEVLGACWGEIDEGSQLWTIPAGRMKAGRQHRVPLSLGALQIIRKMADQRVDEQKEGFIFPGQKPGRPLSNMSMHLFCAPMTPWAIGARCR